MTPGLYHKITNGCISKSMSVYVCTYFIERYENKTYIGSRKIIKAINELFYNLLFYYMYVLKAMQILTNCYCQIQANLRLGFDCGCLFS